MRLEARHRRFAMTDAADQVGGALEVPIPYYVAALVAYIALGLAFKVVFLNWIVGPLFMAVTIDVLPRVIRRLRRGAR